MAYTEIRRDRDGKTTGYVGRFRIDGKLKCTRLFRTKRDALAEAEAQETAGKASEWIDPKAGAVTLADYFASWQARRADRAPRTLEAEAERFASLISPAFGSTPLRRLDYDGIAQWAATMQSKRSGRVASQARRRDAARLLVAVLDGAVEAGRIARNPARTKAGKVPYLPRASRTKAHRYISHEQLRRTVEAANSDQARAVILLAGLTGLRWGELSALTVADIDLMRGRVKVGRAYTRLDNGTLLLGETKTHARREVAIGAALRDVLTPLLGGKAKSSLLFATADGKPLRRESFSRSSFGPAVTAAGSAVSALQRLLGFSPELVSGFYDAATTSAVREAQSRNALAATGVCDPATWAALAHEDREHQRRERRGDGSTRAAAISRAHQLTTLSRMTLAPGAEDFPRLTLHDLRHTAASLAVAAGATVKAVQRMLGHESAKLTLDTYAGLFDTDLDTLGQSLSDGYEASAAHYVLTGGGPETFGVTSLTTRRRA
ncbi:MAG: tyrosine-type recombinase/integrase [Cellulomonas sp.]|nr:tyrosine-type recombinase/integrase [Cellulomonas sp.]